MNTTWSEGVPPGTKAAGISEGSGEIVKYMYMYVPCKDLSDTVSE